MVSIGWGRSALRVGVELQIDLERLGRDRDSAILCLTESGAALPASEAPVISRYSAHSCSERTRTPPSPRATSIASHAASAAAMVVKYGMFARSVWRRSE